MLTNLPIPYDLRICNLVGTFIVIVKTSPMDHLQL